MSDLFHRDVPDEYIRKVFNTMVRADWHIFQVLTKRSRRLARLAHSLPWPSHICAGVSVESRQFAWRLDHLRSVPAHVRFVSAEPLLGSLYDLDLSNIQWVITGGESGAGFRDCKEEWVREIRDKCIRERVAFFHKQWGGRTPKIGGRQLDGRTWDEMPDHATTESLLPFVPAT
jgi:protein gp37